SSEITSIVAINLSRSSLCSSCSNALTPNIMRFSAAITSVAPSIRPPSRNSIPSLRPTVSLPHSRYSFSVSQIPKPMKDVAAHLLVTDLLWADPMIKLPSDVKNKVRGVSVYFGEQTLDQVCADLKLRMVIRGHQMMMNGFNFFHSKLVTVFSAAAYYPDKPNRGAVCVIDKTGRVGFKTFYPIPAGHPDSIPKVFRGDHDASNEADTGHVKANPGL
ncbi:hypothetical protein PENTCL1PPCAC_10757, partial [Pristionchus entomophagus]